MSTIICVIYLFFFTGLFQAVSSIDASTIPIRVSLSVFPYPCTRISCNSLK